LTSVEVIDVRSLREQIRRDERDHVRIAAAVVAHVEDHGVDIAERRECFGRLRRAHVDGAEHVELDVADVAGELLRLHEAAIHPVELLLHARLVLGARLGLPLGRGPGHPAHVQVTIVADRLQVIRQRGGEGRAGRDRFVVAVIEVLAERLRHLLRERRVDVRIRELRRDRIDDPLRRLGVDVDPPESSEIQRSDSVVIWSR
jgi:hypothetical protein